MKLKEIAKELGCPISTAGQRTDWDLGSKITVHQVKDGDDETLDTLDDNTAGEPLQYLPGSWYWSWSIDNIKKANFEVIGCGVRVTHDYFPIIWVK